MTDSTTGSVPIHVGQPSPGSQAAVTAQFSIDTATRWGLHSLLSPLRVPADIDWESHGLSPRWLGQESSGCSAAIDPGGLYGGAGATERDRFLAGAKERHEVAVLLAGIGDATGTAGDGGTRNVFGASTPSVWIRDHTSVVGRRLPQGTVPQVAEGLCQVDRDLALRLINAQNENAVWWALDLTRSTPYQPGRRAAELERSAEGRLLPILVDSLGAPVVATWVSEAEDERWYIVPDGTDWDLLLDWLISRALPGLVPNAMRRARSGHLDDPALQTRAERLARVALEDLDYRFGQDRSRLQSDLDAARKSAQVIRENLLFAAGHDLAHAVAEVFKDSGLEVVDLDDVLGPKSADLLVTGPSGERRLVEVKSASGNPKENLTQALNRHLETWPQLRPEQPVVGGALIVNHQRHTYPTERAEEVYGRDEFVKSLTFPVLSTWQLFRWWAEGDHELVVQAIFPAVDRAAVEPGQSRKRGWLRRASDGPGPGMRATD